MSNPIAFRIEPVYYISIKACGLFLEKKDSPLNGKAQKPSSCNGFGGGLERFPTGQSPVMPHTHEVTGSSPVVSTKQKVHPKGWAFLFGAVFTKGTRTNRSATVRWTVAAPSANTEGYNNFCLGKNAYRVP